MNRQCLRVQSHITTDLAKGERICCTYSVVIGSHLTENRLAYETRYGSSGLDYGIGTSNPVSQNKIEGIAARRRLSVLVLYRMFVAVSQMLETVCASRCIRDEACMLCHMIVDQEFVQGQNRTVVAAALVMNACRLHGSILEWSDVHRIGHKRTRTFGHLLSFTDFTHSKYTKELISRKCTDINLSVRWAGNTILILNEMRNVRFTDGKKPQCVAAAAIALSGTDTPIKKSVAASTLMSDAWLQKILSAGKSRVR